MTTIKYIWLILLMVCATLPCKANQPVKSNFKLTGKVVDAVTSAPLAGISISLPGVSAAMTADDGSFSIQVPSYDVELSVSGPAYCRKLVPLKGREHIVIRLNDESFHASVYKDVPTPLGEVNHARLTHSVAFLDRDNSLSTAVTAGELLQGQVSGLNTILRSGMEGAGTTQFVRGFNSIYSNNQPLLVVDGLVMENKSAGMSLISGYLSTPLGLIDVKDIQRITVLKDGGSLYGVKGANGVILIETLRAKNVATKIALQATTGMNMTPSKIPLLNASQHKKYLIDQYQSTGKYSASEIENLPFVNTQKPVQQNWGYEGNIDYYRYNKSTDWQEELFSESFKQNYALSVTGGDDVAAYALTLGFQNNEGVVKGTDYSRFNARINTDINLSRKAKVHSSMSFVYGQKNLRDEAVLKSTNPIYASLVKTPFMAGHLYNEFDLMSPNLEGVDMFGLSNPMAILQKAKMENTNYSFLGNVEASYQVLKHLKISTLIGLHFGKEREKIFLPGVGIRYDTLSTAVVKNKSQHRVERILSLMNETKASYIHQFSHDHTLDFTLGMRYQHNKTEDDWGKGYNSASDDFVSINYGLNTLRQVGGSLGEWNWLAFYANAGYAYKNRYFATVTASFDASSRYGGSVGDYQAFPALSVAWLISSEEFMQNLKAIDLLKLRVSYSMTGNDDIGNYTARHYYKPQNILGNYGLVRGNVVNLNLKPERNAKFDVGVDMAFLNERLSFSADFYKSKITDMITYSPVSPVSGFSTYISNGGEMQNTGVDLALNARLLNLPALKWDLGANVSFYKNKVLRLPGGSYQTDIAEATILTRVGSPAGLFYGYKTQGVYATSAEAAADNLYQLSGLNKQAFGAGDIRFVNQNDDDLIDENDRCVIGNPNPDMYGGFTTSVRWKRFMLSALFSYSVGNDIYNYTRREVESIKSFANQTQAVLNRWKVEGQVTDMPKATYGDPMHNSRFSDRWIEDGSYLKFKNLTLSYDIPIKQGVITGLQVYAVGENLATLTAYKGYDPEFSVSSNPLGYGIDAFVTPSCRTFYVGVKIGL